MSKIALIKEAYARDKAALYRNDIADIVITHYKSHIFVWTYTGNMDIKSLKAIIFKSRQYSILANTGISCVICSYRADYSIVSQFKIFKKFGNQNYCSDCLNKPVNRLDECVELDDTALLLCRKNPHCDYLMNYSIIVRRASYNYWTLTVSEGNNIAMPYIEERDLDFDERRRIKLCLMMRLIVLNHAICGDVCCYIVSFIISLPSS